MIGKSQGLALRVTRVKGASTRPLVHISKYILNTGGAWSVQVMADSPGGKPKRLLIDSSLLIGSSL